MDKNDHALVMGATYGLGAALCEEALARGIAPIGLGRSHMDTPYAEEGLTRVTWDVTDETTWRRAFDMIARSQVRYVIWNAGIFEGRAPLKDVKDVSIDRLIDTHLRGPVKFLARAHRMMVGYGAPYALAVVASTSSYRMRDGETVYCAVKAAKAAFTRQFSRELARELPGSRTLLMNPGGMRSGFLAPYADVSKMMEPRAVAVILWDRLLGQTSSYDEINVIREADGAPRVEPGIKTHETP